MRLLRISSKDRSIGSESKYKLKFPTNDSDLHQVRRIMLKSAILPNTQYNVHAGNNTFSYEIADVLYSFNITPAQYTTDTLITAVIAGFAAELVPITMTIIQDAATSKLSFTSDTSIQWLNRIDGSSIGQMMGITTSSTIASTTHTASGVPQLQGLRHVYIASNALSNNTSMITDDKNKYNIFADIPITVPYGGMEIVDNDSSTLDYIDFNCKKNISSIDIELLDEHNDTLDLLGHDFILVFAVF